MVVVLMQLLLAERAEEVDEVAKITLDVVLLVEVVLLEPVTHNSNYSGNKAGVN